MVRLFRGERTRRSFLEEVGKALGVGSLGVLVGGVRLQGRGDSASVPTAGDEAGVAMDEHFWSIVRSQFPLTRDRVYMNNGGLGPSPYQVLRTVQQAMEELESICETGHEKIEGVRQRAAAFLGCLPEELAFTHNTTEGMNLIARGLPLKPGDEVLMSTHEHVGGAMPWLALMKERGLRVRLFEPADTAERNLEIIERNLTPRTRVLSISHMTCTVGTLFPAKELARLCEERKIWFVLDGAHPPGQLCVNLHELGCHFYATSGHKWLLGPKGTGLLYVRKDMHGIWKPVFVGAHSDAKYDLDRLMLEYLPEARCVEYGTRNVPLVLGLGAAIDFLAALGMRNVEARGRYLSEQLLQGLQGLPQVEILTPQERGSRGAIVAFRLKGKASANVVQELSRRGFRTRPVTEQQLDAVRVSCHVYTLVEDVRRLIEEIRVIASS
ncbi:MAG: aminotransferase class V-fold PLP-dependent enzyme [candidate division KSB1 bacterium]|nr:aminotransferase class V-fold PLP-dependent enzyme [candidate division KSB1 bacterium]